MNALRLLAAFIFVVATNAEPHVDMLGVRCGRWRDQVLAGWEDCTPFAPGCHRQVRPIWYCMRPVGAGAFSFIAEPSALTRWFWWSRRP